MSAHDATESARGLAVPSCPQCNQLETVRPVHVSEVDSVVQYWSCGACGRVWATRDDQELRSIAADRGPRKSA
jgi:hypothetical protein